MAENRCMVHQEWRWVRRGGFVPLSTSKHLRMLCKANEFAVGQDKDTSYQGKVQAAFTHLDLKYHYLARNFERTKSVSTTRNAVEVLHLQQLSSRHALPDMHPSQAGISSTQPLYNPVKLSPASVQTLYSQRWGSVQGLSQLQSTSEWGIKPISVTTQTFAPVWVNQFKPIPLGKYLCADRQWLGIWPKLGEYNVNACVLWINK